MKSRIWQLAGVSLLCMNISAQALADEPQNRGPDGGGRGPEHQGNNQGHGGDHQQRGQNNPQPQNQPRPQSNEIIRGDNSRQFEHNAQQNNGQNQSRPAYNPNPVRQPPPPPQLPANSLPIQPRPDAVRQTQEPRQGYYRDERPQNGYNISIGRPAIGPTTTTGRDVRTVTAMVGAPARNIARGM